MINFIFNIFFFNFDKKSSANSKYPFFGKISLAETKELIHKQFKSN